MKITDIVSEIDLTSIKKFGIYKISYKKKVYIGSTTQSFYLRWIQHISDLKKKKPLFKFQIINGKFVRLA